MFGRRRKVPERRPHPDPCLETELQRILSMRAAIARKEAALKDIQETVKYLRYDARFDPKSAGTVQRFKQIERYRRETRELEREISRLHEEIEKRCAALDVVDLAYL
jgi:predicted phage-related endonuclease